MALPNNIELAGVMYARYSARPGRIAMPDVCCDLVWVGERLFLGGPTRRGQLSMRQPGQEIQLLNLDPLAARAWLGVPLEQFVDRDIPLEAIDTNVAGRISELFATGRAIDLVRPIAQPPQEYRRAAAAAAVLRRGRPVSHAAAVVDLSRRQLERLFADQFGLAPWQYARILRFRRAVEKVKAGHTFAEAATMAGYADQSHFTRATRDLTDQSPGALMPNVANVQDAVVRTRDY